MTNFRKLGRTCSECGTGIRDDSKTGLCKTHCMTALNRDPELNQRRAETLSRTQRFNPETRARNLKILAEARSRRDPEELRRKGKALAHLLVTNPEKQRINHAIAMRARRHKWLPEEWRPTYQRMLRSGGFKAHEAKRIILDQVEAERRRIGARLRVSGKSERETIDAAANAVSGSKRLLEAMRSMAQ